MATHVTLIPGDGIGPGITDATVRVLEAAGCAFVYDKQLAGMAAVAAYGDPMPESTIERDFFMGATMVTYRGSRESAPAHTDGQRLTPSIQCRRVVSRVCRSSRRAISL